MCNYRSWGKRSDRNILSSNDQIREFGLAKLDFVMFLLSCWSVSRWCFLLDFLDISTGYLSADRVSTDCLSGTKHSSKHDSEQSTVRCRISQYQSRRSNEGMGGGKSTNARLTLPRKNKVKFAISSFFEDVTQGSWCQQRAVLQSRNLEHSINKTFSTKWFPQCDWWIKEGQLCVT